MKKVPFGKPGYLVSPVVYAGIVSMKEDQADSDGYVSKAIQAGVNYFDVAPSYGDAEIILGNSLKPYRKNVYLACKTMCRKAEDAKKELSGSLKNLHTDWLDVYQLHAMTTLDDVETAFGHGGTMELMVKLKQEGVVRKIGFSAHSEQAALECLRRYPFDSVMFPINWMLHMGQDIGSRLIKAAGEQGLALLGIKSIVERAWFDEDERNTSPWPKSWCKPFHQDDPVLRIAAMKYSLSLGVSVLVPPGNWECQSFMMEHIQKCLDEPLSEQERDQLSAYYQKVKAFPFFKASDKQYR